MNPLGAIKRGLDDTSNAGLIVCVLAFLLTGIGFFFDWYLSANDIPTITQRCRREPTLAFFLWVWFMVMPTSILLHLLTFGRK